MRQWHTYAQYLSGVGMRDVKGDLFLCSWGDTLQAEREDLRLNSAGRIRDALSEWQGAYDLAGVLWRQERWPAKFAKMDPRAYEEHPEAYEPLHEVDDAKAAIEGARAAGVKIYCYVDMYDEGMPPHVDNYTRGPYPWESTFFADHPDYYSCDRTWEERHWGVPEYAYPEVRHYKCREELAYLVDNYEWDGVYISTRGHRMPAAHGDRYGFNLPVAEAFQQRYGVDILTQNFDLEAWRRLRGEFVTAYLREVRELCDERSLTLGIGVPPGDYFGPPLGNLYLDWRTWVREKIVDFIIPGHANVVGRHLRMGYGYLTSYFEGEFGLQPLPELLAEEYGPLCKEHGVGLWASLMIRERLAKLYGRKYSNEMLRSIPGVNGLSWSWASKGDRMLTADLDDSIMPSPLAPEGT